MTVLTTSLDRRSEVFAANAAAMRALVEDLREKVAAIREGGAAASRSPMTSAGGSDRSSSGLPRFLRWALRWMRSINSLDALYQEAAVGAIWLIREAGSGSAIASAWGERPRASSSSFSISPGCGAGPASGRVRAIAMVRCSFSDDPRSPRPRGVRPGTRTASRPSHVPRFPLARSGRDGKVRLRMTILTTSIDRRSEVFAANAAAMRALVEDLREKVAAIREGGGEAARRRHLARGK